MKNGSRLLEWLAKIRQGDLTVFDTLRSNLKRNLRAKTGLKKILTSSVIILLERFCFIAVTVHGIRLESRQARKLFVYPQNYVTFADGTPRRIRLTANDRRHFLFSVRLTVFSLQLCKPTGKYRESSDVKSFLHCFRNEILLMAGGNVILRAEIFSFKFVLSNTSDN